MLSVQMLKRINTTFKKNTLLIGACSLSARYLLGDYIVQCAVEGRVFGKNRNCAAANSNSTGNIPSPVRYFQWERLATFGTFGFLYGGSFGYLFYNKLYSSVKMFRKNPLATAIFDVCTHCMFIYMPGFYATQSLIFEYAAREEMNSEGGGGPFSAVEFVKDALSQAKANYVSNFKEDFRNMAIVWIPLHFVNFWGLPLHYRLPFISVAGFFWAAVISGSRGTPSSQRSDEDASVLLHEDSTRDD